MKLPLPSPAPTIAVLLATVLTLAPRPAIAAPTASPGYLVETFASGPPLSWATGVAFDADGVLHVSVANLFNGTGRVLRAADLDGDGQADAITEYAAGFGVVTGIAFRPPDPATRHGETALERIRRGAFRGARLELFVSHFVPGSPLSGAVSVVRDRDGDGVAEERDDVVTGLPSDGQNGNQQPVFGPDGRLYFGQGGRTNSGQPGSGPPDLPENGTILTAAPSGADLRIHAEGLRNAFDLLFLPGGELLATENGPDASGPNPVVGAPDELNSIVPCGDYGWPAHTGFPPEGSGTIGPVLAFGSGTSSDGIALATRSTRVGDEGDLLVAQFGSFTDPAIGRKVLRIRSVGGRALLVEELATGFGRPLDLAFGPAGDLYVADFSNEFLSPDSAVLYRIRRDPLAPRPPAPPAGPGSGPGTGSPLCGP